MLDVRVPHHARGRLTNAFAGLLARHASWTGPPPRSCWPLSPRSPGSVRSTSASGPRIWQLGTISPTALSAPRTSRRASTSYANRSSHRSVNATTRSSPSTTWRPPRRGPAVGGPGGARPAGEADVPAQRSVRPPRDSRGRSADRGRGQPAAAGLRDLVRLRAGRDVHGGRHVRPGRLLIHDVARARLSLRCHPRPDPPLVEKAVGGDLPLDHLRLIV